jgi:predicted ester cyclase
MGQDGRKTMSKSKIMTLTALITLALGITAIGNAEADEEKNKTIVKRNVEEIWNKGNVSVAEEIVATDYVRHLPGGKEIRGRERYKEYVKGFYTTFPDARFTMKDLIAVGDYVVLRWSCVGTHTGKGIGSPTGKEFEITGIVIYRLAGGKMVEDWSEFDRLVLMQQLGYKLVPPGKE